MAVSRSPGGAPSVTHETTRRARITAPKTVTVSIGLVRRTSSVGSQTRKPARDSQRNGRSGRSTATSMTASTATTPTNGVVEPSGRPRVGRRGKAPDGQRDGADLREHGCTLVPRGGSIGSAG